MEYTVKALPDSVVIGCSVVVLLIIEIVVAASVD